jgi:predicted aminopeptidase
MAAAIRVLLSLSALASLSGCYLMQAAGGQLEVARSSRPIEEVLASPAVDERVRGKLELVNQAREFATQALGLPEGRSYREYADLGRPYPLWNVVATPEFSVEPRLWCFPITGCVAYRGYFHEADALAAARGLRARGYDVSIGGVPTYSTLGHLKDPVFSTMLAWPETRLVGTIFHEMAHEQLYVRGDSSFNEAYATVIAQEGLRQWLIDRDEQAQLDTVRASSARERQFSALLGRTRERLAALYRTDDSPATKRLEKQRLFGELKFEYSQLRSEWGSFSGYDTWFARPLNNAHLAAVATYDDCVPGLERELTVAGSIQAFAKRARELARLPLAERRAAVCEPRAGEDVSARDGRDAAIERHRDPETQPGHFRGSQRGLR